MAAYYTRSCYKLLRQVHSSTECEHACEAVAAVMPLCSLCGLIDLSTSATDAPRSSTALEVLSTFAVESLA